MFSAVSPVTAVAATPKQDAIAIRKETESSVLDLLKSEPEWEFRSHDDAWYSVRLVCEAGGETLVVKYSGLPDDYNDQFSANKFSTIEEAHDFRRRFRPVSPQAQDYECPRVVKGTMVSAAFAQPGDHGDEFRYYDAVVDTVISREHSFASGEECCFCTFVLLWQFGPKAGARTSVGIDSICHIQSDSHVDDPRLKYFMEHAEGSTETMSEGSGSVVQSHKSFTMQRELTAHSSQSTDNRSQHKDADIKMEGHDGIEKSNSEGENVQDSHDYHLIMVEFVENELSPLTLSKFIYEQTCILVKATVLPSLTSEVYTRAVLVVESMKKLQRLCSFLDHPDHMIISSKGRPWVLYETQPCKPYQMSFGIIEATELIKVETRHELKIAQSGTEEYRKAKKLKSLFLEFSCHTRALHKSLFMEESYILHAPGIDVMRQQVHVAD